MGSSDNNYKTLADNLDRFLTEHKPDKLVLSTAHGLAEIENLRMLASPEVQSVLHKHEFYDIALEARIEFSDEAQAVADGALTPEQLGQEAVKAYKEAGDKLAESAAPIYQERGELIAASAQRGTMVHFVEAMDKDLKEHFTSIDKTSMKLDFIERMTAEAQADEAGWGDIADGLFDKSREYVAEKVGADSIIEDVVRERIAEKSQTIRSNQVIEPMLQSILDERQGYDQELANSINEVTEGRNTVVMYGNDHGSGKQDLNEYLGPNTARIVLASDKNYLWERSQYDYSLGRQQPDAYLNVNNGDMISGEEAYKAAEKYDPDLQQKSTEPVAEITQSDALKFVP